MRSQTEAGISEGTTPKARNSLIQHVFAQRTALSCCWYCELAGSCCGRVPVLDISEPGQIRVRALQILEMSVLS